MKVRTHGSSVITRTILTLMVFESLVVELGPDPALLMFQRYTDGIRPLPTVEHQSAGTLGDPDLTTRFSQALLFAVSFE
jgi:hypothetical protein